MTTASRRVARAVSRPGAIRSAARILLLACCIAAVSSSSVEGAVEHHGYTSAGTAVWFVPNVGQANDHIVAEARGLDRVVGLARDTTLVGQTASVRLLNAAPDYVGLLEPKAGRMNFLLGDDPGGWRTGVPTYGAVRLTSAVPGADLTLSCVSGALIARLHLNGDLPAVHARWQVEGISAAELVDASRLLQGVSNDRSAVAAARFELEPGNIFTTHVSRGATEAYIPLDALFASYLGGTRDDSASDVALDADANPIVVGSTSSTNFPIRDPAQPEISSLSDAFVAKLSADGSNLIWGTYLGGNQHDHGYAVAVGAEGRPYVVGYSDSKDFPTKDPLQSASGGENDAFVTVLTADGSSIEFSTLIGGRADDYAYAVALGPPLLGGPNRQIYVAGGTDSSDFPTEAAYQKRYGSDSDAFVCAIKPDRSGYLYSTYLGGNSPETAYGVAVGPRDQAYVTGYVNGPGFPVENPFQRSFRGESDVFVTKLSPDGQKLIYSTYLGGRDNDEAQGIALDGDEAVVVGFTYSKDFPKEEAYQPSLRGTTDAFVTRLSEDGSALVFSTFFGGTVDDSGRDIAIDVDGSLHLTGTTNSTSFPVVDAVQGRLRGLEDAFASTLSGDGQRLLFSTFYGGSQDDQSRAIEAAGDGSVYFVGYTDSADFPTEGGFQPDYRGQGDAFVVRLQAIGEIETPVPTTPIPSATFTASATSPVSATPTLTSTSDLPQTDTPSPTGTATEFASSTPSPSATATPTEEAGRYYNYLPFAEKH